MRPKREATGHSFWGCGWGEGEGASSDLCLSLQSQFRALLSPSLSVLQPHSPPLASEMYQALPFLTQDFCFVVLSTCMFPSSTPTLPDVHNRK